MPSSITHQEIIWESEEEEGAVELLAAQFSWHENLFPAALSEPPRAEKAAEIDAFTSLGCLEAHYPLGSSAKCSLPLMQPVRL